MNELLTPQTNTSRHNAARIHSPLPLLVAYDIADNRRRNRLHRLLRGFGEPIQKSVFICWLDPSRRQRLQSVLEDFSRTAHGGRERIDCVVAHNYRVPDWLEACVFE